MTLRFASLVAALILGVCCWTAAAAQAPYAPGAVIGLQGAPHLFVVGDDGLLHWAGDTRALQGRWVVWSDRHDVTLAELQALPRDDPWLSAGLVKDGDPIYLVKWETTDVYPTLLHIQSIADVELFGINGSNYGYFVWERQDWEQAYQFSLEGTPRGQLQPIIGGAVTPVPAPPEQTIIFVAGLGTAMSSWSYKDTPFQGIHNALANAGVSYSHYNFSYSGGPDYSCEQTGQPYETSARHLTALILAARTQFPDNPVTLIGHSYGGLLSYLQLHAVENGAIPAGAIENIITLDAPLYGSGRLRAILAGVLTNYCESQAASSEAAETIKAIYAAGVSWQQELTRLAHVGRDNSIEVFTIGNTHDCVYNPNMCSDVSLTNFLLGAGCVLTGGWWCAGAVVGLGATSNNAASQIVQSQLNSHWLGNFGNGDGSIVASHNVVRQHPAVLDAIVQAVRETWVP